MSSPKVWDWESHPCLIPTKDVVGKMGQNHFGNGCLLPAFEGSFWKVRITSDPTNILVFLTISPKSSPRAWEPWLKIPSLPHSCPIPGKRIYPEFQGMFQRVPWLERWEGAAELTCSEGRWLHGELHCSFQCGLAVSCAKIFFPISAVPGVFPRLGIPLELPVDVQTCGLSVTEDESDFLEAPGSVDCWIWGFHESWSSSRAWFGMEQSRDFESRDWGFLWVQLWKLGVREGFDLGILGVPLILQISLRKTHPSPNQDTKIPGDPTFSVLNPRKKKKAFIPKNKFSLAVSGWFGARRRSFPAWIPSLTLFHGNLPNSPPQPAGRREEFVCYFYFSNINKIFSRK